MDKLNKCLEILDSTDLGTSLAWLWSWSTIKDILDSTDWEPMASEDEIWDRLVKLVDSGNGFTLEYGAEDHLDAVLGWMMDEELIKDSDEEEVDGDDETVFE
jgi:hypothetical protein